MPKEAGGVIVSVKKTHLRDRRWAPALFLPGGGKGNRSLRRLGCPSGTLGSASPDCSGFAIVGRAKKVSFVLQLGLKFNAMSGPGFMSMPEAVCTEVFPRKRLPAAGFNLSAAGAITGSFRHLAQGARFPGKLPGGIPGEGIGFALVCSAQTSPWRGPRFSAFPLTWPVPRYMVAPR
jgi:hypothetical protein